MSEALQFPKPEPTDSEDVVWALEAASSMWERGDGREAIRWLRRAAESAGDTGNDMRALALARAAADLAAIANIPPSIPPPAPMVPRENPTAPIQPVDDSDGPSGMDYTIPDGLEAVRPPDSYRPPAPAQPQPAGPPPLRRSSPVAAPPPSRPAPSSPAAAPPSRPASSSPSTAPSALALRPRQALRVAVEPSPDDKNLLLVRPLAEGEPVPEHMHEAVLTALEAGAHLISRKR